MRIIYYASTLLLSSMSLVSCAAITDAPETPQEAPQQVTRSAEQVKYEMTLAEAKAAQTKAASVNGEWRDIGKILKSAVKAAESGDYAKATKLAAKAKDQGDLGYKQAMAEKLTHHPSYLH